MSIEAMKLALQLVEVVDELALDCAVFGNDVSEERALIARCKIAFLEAIKEAEKQKPFGYMPDWAVNQLNGSLVYEKPLTWGLYTHVYVGPVDGYIPIYNAPLQRQPRKRKWVGLTDEEVMVSNRQSYDAQIGLLPLTFYRAIEAKLREKNGC
jgi:hypothetical protein